MTEGQNLAEEVPDWTSRPGPAVAPMEGRFVRLERLDPGRHADGLFEASEGSDAEERFRWLFERPPVDRTDCRAWTNEASAKEDPLFFAVIDKATGKVAGRQSFMRIDAPNGVMEIGCIYWGALVSRKPGATEAFYLFASHAFDDLGYRRFEWKCDRDNLPSKRAALRFGFEHEGVFRQHMVVKGLNRDTAWFAMLDKDWCRLKRAFEAWLAPENFDPAGVQKRKLEEIRAEIGCA